MPPLITGLPGYDFRLNIVQSVAIRARTQDNVKLTLNDVRDMDSRLITSVCRKFQR